MTLNLKFKERIGIISLGDESFYFDDLKEVKRILKSFDTIKLNRSFEVD